MNYEAIYLTRKEKRRFLEIAQGDTKAKNTPEEDALFRAGLVKESMLAHFDLDTNQSTVDMRAVVLSDLGGEYYAQYKNQQENGKRDTRRFLGNIIITAIGAIATILSIIVAVQIAGYTH